MSDQTSGRSGDWRRRRRPTAGTQAEAAAPAGSQATETASGPGGEVVLSRTIFSFIEPVLNTIGSYAAPMVIAGVVALVVTVDQVTDRDYVKNLGAFQVITQRRLSLFLFPDYPTHMGPPFRSGRSRRNTGNLSFPSGVCSWYFTSTTTRGSR